MYVEYISVYKALKNQWSGSVVFDIIWVIFSSLFLYSIVIKNPTYLAIIMSAILQANYWTGWCLALPDSWPSKPTIIWFWTNDFLHWCISVPRYTTFFIRMSSLHSYNYFTWIFSNTSFWGSYFQNAVTPTKLYSTRNGVYWVVWKF